MANRRRKTIIALIAALAVIVIIIIPFLKAGRKQPIIHTAKVTRGSVTATVSGNGVLEALTIVEVKSNVGGQVVQLAVDEGDTVRAGQVIARMDPSDSLTNLEQSSADLESALAGLRQAKEQSDMQPKLTELSIKQAKSGLESAKANLSQTETALIPQKKASARAALDQANASYDQAEKNLTRQKALLEGGYVAKSVVESAEQQYGVAKAQKESAQRKWDTVKDETDQDLKAAQARVREAEAALESAKVNAFQIRVKRDDVVQSQAQVEHAEAVVRNAQTQMGYTTIIAPRSGVVVKKYVEAGSIITAGKSSMGGTGAGITIVDIADVSRMRILVDVDETDIAQIKIGQKVEIAVESYPDKRFTGEVTKIAPQAVVDQSITTIPVTVEIAQPDRRLKPGMNATCDFIIARKDDVLVAPNEAVKVTPRGSTVTMMERGKPVPRPVKVGIEGSEVSEIISGLREGDEVVIGSIESGSSERGSSGDRPRQMHVPL
jgi:HlyD family secretion protein